MQTFTWKHFFWYLIFLSLLVGGMATLILTQGRLVSSPAYAAGTALQPAQSTTESIEIALDNDTLQPGQQSMVTAILRDGAGRPMADQLVVFHGKLGDVSPASAITDAQGTVIALYAAGSRSGQAQVTVLAGYTFASAPLTIGKTGSQPGGPYRVYVPAIAR